MASLRELSARDKRIREINRHDGRLNQERLRACRDLILRAYESESIVSQLSRVADVLESEPAGFRVIPSRQEKGSLRDFNDPTFRWESYCREMGWGVAFGERTYMFEVLKSNVPFIAGTASNGESDFEPVIRAIETLAEAGYAPDILCAPISLMVEFIEAFGEEMRWGSHPRATLITPQGRELRVFWSNKFVTLDRFIVFDSAYSLWKVKPDPDTGHRLSVAIGELPEEPGAVAWLAETVARYELMDRDAFLAVPATGQPGEVR